MRQGRRNGQWTGRRSTRDDGKQKVKKDWTKFKSISNLWDNTNMSNIYLIWVLEGKEDGGVGIGKRTEIFEGNIGQNFSKLMKT